jgi:hypothetical protein
MFLGCLLTLSLLVAPARERSVSDAPVVERLHLLTPREARGCLACAFGWSEEGGLRLSVRTTPFLVILDLLLRIDAYLFGPGHLPSRQALTGPLRFSVVALASPLSREPREAESLSAYVLEVRELSIVAAARQQGQAGLWAELRLADNAVAHGAGYPIGGATTLGWFGSHLLEVRSPRAHIPSTDLSVFIFASLENGLVRDDRAFRRASALPGIGIGMLWKNPRYGALTLTSGANAGPWLDLQTGVASPGYSLNLESLSLRF